MIRAVLFDFDGVIVPSEQLHMKTFLEQLKPYGVSITTEEWYREFAGTGSRHILQVLMKDYGINEELDEMIQKRSERYEKYVRNGELKETRGFSRFLDYLEKKGIKKAIVSGGHRSNIELVLGVLDLEKRFDLIVCGDEMKERKPSPIPYLLAAKKLGVKPNECIGIEDSPAGCEAVRKAGMRLIVMKSPSGEHLNGYDVLINDFTEFPLEMILL